VVSFAPTAQLQGCARRSQAELSAAILIDQPRGVVMLKSVAIAALAAGVFAGPWLIIPAQAADNSQQSKMTQCNKDAAGKKGDERKSFMSSCLSSKTATPAPMTQQQRMAQCNKDSAGKKGDERKSFMSSCLSNKS
jgi:hypothetical protein